MVTFRHEQLYRRDDKTGVGSFVAEIGILMGRKRVNEALSATGVEETSLLAPSSKTETNNQSRINEMCDL